MLPVDRDSWTNGVADSYVAVDYIVVPVLQLLRRKCVMFVKLSISLMLQSVARTRGGPEVHGNPKLARVVESGFGHRTGDS